MVDEIGTVRRGRSIIKSSQRKSLERKGSYAMIWGIWGNSEELSF